MMYRKFGEKGTGCSTVAEKSSGSRIINWQSLCQLILIP